MIDCKANLLELFDEPCRGVRKKIKIAYVARYIEIRYVPGVRYQGIRFAPNTRILAFSACSVGSALGITRAF